MNAQAAIKAGDKVTVRESTGNASGGSHAGFSTGFVRQFGNIATVESVIGHLLCLRFNNLLVAATTADLVAAETSQIQATEKQTQPSKP